MRKIVDKETANDFAFLYSIVASTLQAVFILGISYLLTMMSTFYMVAGMILYSTSFIRFVSFIEILIYRPFEKYLYRNDQACKIAMIIVGVILFAAIVIAWVFCFTSGGGWLILLALFTTVNLFNGFLAANEVFGLMNEGRLDELF